MCGIFGAVQLDRNTAQPLKPAVEKGVSLLAHRGPDASGVVCQNEVAFGHARLSIIDLGGGTQPMKSADGLGLLSYNGEVYNFAELRSELEAKGQTFSTHSDTEVVLAAYRQWGADCVRRLRGMFAFAVADFRRRTVLLARDHLGVKPLFHTALDSASAKTLWFSSELEPLYQAAGPFSLDLSSVDDCLEWQYIAAPKTIYNEVGQLPPAHWIEIDLDTGKSVCQRYWHPEFHEDKTLSEEEWGLALDKTLRESVNLQLVSDVPFGAFLSGGIDSSLVVGYMSEIMSTPVKTFTAVFGEREFSEADHARAVADIFKTEHFEEQISPECLDLLPLLVKHYGQPYADSSAIPTYYVCHMAHKHVKMALSGDGGDENFAGYRSYELALRALMPDWRDGDGIYGRARAIARYMYRKWMHHGLSIQEAALRIHSGNSRHFSAPGRNRLWLPSGQKLLSEKRKTAAMDARREWMHTDNQPIVSSLQRLDLLGYLPYDILTKVDIAAMACSLEVRVPLLDHIVVETAARMPASLKLKALTDNTGRKRYEKKYILRELARRKLPVDLVDRPKQGFRLPLKVWFANELRSEIRQRLCSSEIMGGLFDIREVSRLVDNHSLEHDASPRIWNLLFLEQWLKTHPDALAKTIR